MFQKHSIMSLKKKSKSLGHLTALGSQPCSPDVEPKVRDYHPVSVPSLVINANDELEYLFWSLHVMLRQE